MAETSRRRLLARAASATPALVLAAGPALAVAAVPDPHLAWWEEIQELDRIDDFVRGRTDEQVEVEMERSVHLEELMAEPARTREGVMAQLRMALRGLERFGTSPRETDVLDAALATLERLWPEAAHA